MIKTKKQKKTEKCVKKLRPNDTENHSNLNIGNHNNKIIVTEEIKLKNIQKIIRKQITPKCQLKWDTFYEKQFNWKSIWHILNKIKCK